MARIAGDGVILTIALLLLVFHNDTVVAFTSRSLLYMANGNPRDDDKRIIGKTSLSISTTPSPLASIKSSATAGVINERSNKRKNNKLYRRKGRPNTNDNKKVSAPLVDSTLLRFLSAQKKQIAAQEMILDGVDVDVNNTINNGNNINIVSSVVDNIETATSSNATRKGLDLDIESIIQIGNVMNETELIQSMTDNLKIENDNDDDTQTIERKIIITNNENEYETNNQKSSTQQQVADTTADSISWFTQYNAHNVANKLIELGASMESAQDAGNAVQNYSLTRTTRQRVRKFLSERDSIWASTSSSASENEDYKKISTIHNFSFIISSREQNYNIDDIIDVLTNAGLSGKDIAEIFTHTPSVSMMQAKSDVTNSNESSKVESLEATLNRSYFGVLCSKIKLRKCDARKVLRCCPGLLTKRGSSSSEEVISILATLGVAPTSLCRDKSALPILLSRSPASLFRLVAFLSSDAVRMPVNRIGPLFRRSECASLLDYVAPLSNRQTLDSSIIFNDLLNGENNEMVTEITRRYTMMFKTAKYLRRVVGMNDLGRSVSAYANILTLDVEKQIEPCITFLSDEIGLYEEEISSVLELYPQLLGENISKMRQNVEYLRSLEVMEEDICSIFRAFPALLTLEVSSMTEVVKFLKDIGVTNIGRFVTRLPPVLGYSVVDDLMPKWKYLTSVRNYASFEISRFPAYFSYPLDRVIRNRYDYLLKVKQLPVQLIPIDEVLRYGDKDFAILVAIDDDESAYLDFVNERRTSKRQPYKSNQRKKSIKKNKL